MPQTEQHQGFSQHSPPLRHCPFPNSTSHRMGWPSDGRCPWVHVCVNPILAARGPGQPPNSRCGDREAADVGAAPSGCPEACAGEQASPRERHSGWRASGSCAFSLSSKLSFPSPEGNLFLTSVCGLFEQDLEQKMKVVENLQDDFDFNYKTLKSQGGK